MLEEKPRYEWADVAKQRLKLGMNGKKDLMYAGCSWELRHITKFQTFDINLCEATESLLFASSFAQNEFQQAYDR